MKHKLLFCIILYLFGFSTLHAQISLEDRQSKVLVDTNKTSLIDLKSDPEFRRLAGLKANLTKAQQKLSTDLLQLVKPEFLPKATSLDHHSKMMKSLKQFRPFEQSASFEESINEGSVYVYVYLKEGNPTSIINSICEEVTDRDEKNHVAVAWVKVKNLEALTLLDGVRIIRTVIPPLKKTGSVNTEGDAIHQTSNVRSIFGKDGTGVKVGIISDGVDTRASAQASGDLPPDGLGLTVLSNTYGGDEGTAMLEIVHDMVPGAELYFHDLGGNTVAFNSAIDNLIAAGCNIICDDIGWLLEPFYEDGIVASHVNSVIAANDIIYVSSAGNSGNYHYQGNFVPLTAFPTRHDFSGVNSGTPYLYVELSPGENVIVVLQWDDPFGGSNNDYDLELRLNSNGSLVTQSNAKQNGTQDPLEAFSYTNPSPTQTRIYQIRVINYMGLAAVKNLEVFFYPGGGTYYTNNIKSENSIYGHPAVDGVVSVGAVRYNTPSTIEYFSSQGPSTIAFPSSQTRQTPKIVGVDGGVITGAGGFGLFDGTNYRFYGTSASAPHIAAILAQAWSVDLNYTPAQIKQFMYDWAIDLGDPGFDNVFGYGRADAFEMFDNTSLPVELSSFSASTIGSTVKLSWKTETEVNNYGFDVERSELSAERQAWEKIGFVNGNGNSNSPKSYTFTDTDVLSGKYSYRLKQIDNDGKFEYSKVIEVDLGAPTKFELSQNYPNPFNPVTTIRFSLPEAGNVKLTLFNILGQEIKTLVNDFKESGVHTINFDATDLNSGMYIYKIEAGNFVQTRKMTLIK